ADEQLTASTSGSEVAARLAEIVIAAAAIVATAAAIAVYSARPAAVAANAGVTATTQTEAGQRVADLIVRVATATTPAQEQAAKQLLVEEVPKLLTRTLGR